MKIKIIKIISILIAAMGIIHIGATFSPLIGGKLSVLDANTQNAMIYMSLMCGLLLITIGSFVVWAICKQSDFPILKTTIRIAFTLLLIDGVSAICFMPHNPFAWIIATLCIIGFYIYFFINNNSK